MQRRIHRARFWKSSTGLAPATTQNTSQHPADDLPAHFAANRTGRAFYQLLADAGTAPSASAAHQIAQFVEHAALRRRLRCVLRWCWRL